MVSVALRGQAYDLAALPATSDIAHMRFGVALHRSNVIRLMGVSSRECVDCRAGCVAYTLLLSRSLFWGHADGPE